MKKYIQLRDNAKNHSVTYRTAWNRFNAGKIPNSFKNGNHSPTQKQAQKPHP
jgi:hypothetical protein